MAPSKKDPETPEEIYACKQHKIVNRLKRARGQLDGVIRAVESGENCRDLVIQLAAVSKALDKAGYAIIASIMRDCVDMENGKDLEREVPTQDEIEKLFLMLA